MKDIPMPPWVAVVAATTPAASEAQGGGQLRKPGAGQRLKRRTRREIIRASWAKPCLNVPAPQAYGVAARLRPPGGSGRCAPHDPR
jgi:hypothetical protein